MRKFREIGLVLQGGGALGAYEYGAIQALLEQGYVPRVISGVSIGAVNTAVLAGARGELVHGEGRDRFLESLRDNMRASLDRMWARLTMPDNPFLPASQQALLSIMGNPAFWSMRQDWLNMAQWTNYYDVKPMYDTLDDIVDFKRINQEKAAVRMAVTATCIETGGNTRFANYGPDETVEAVAAALHVDPSRKAKAGQGAIGTIKARTKIAAAHIMASGALPPSFPGVWIDGRTYWDGGLFDNTPIRPLVEMLTAEEADHLPIVVINLFPHMSPVPKNLLGVSNRMMAIQYQSRFADAYGSYQGVLDYGEALQMLLDVANKAVAHLERDGGELVAEIARLREDDQFRRLLLYRAFKNVTIIPALTDFTQIGPMDFSAHGIGMRRKAGHAAVMACLDDNDGHLSARERRLAREGAEAA